MGLGLAISRKSVRTRGGEISVRDVPGKGCVFTVELPLGLPKHPDTADALAATPAQA